MSGGKKTTTTSNQQQTATTTLPEWMTSAGQQNYQAAQAYVNSPEATWSADKAAAYANPFQQQVQQNTLRQMTEQGAVDRAALNDGVQGAKAFGGTRQAVLEAQQAKDQSQQRADYLATSNAQGYDAARAAFEADRAAKLGGYGALTQILASAPKNVTTSGTSNGTQTQKQSGSFLDTLMGVGQLGLSAAATFSDRRSKRDVQWLDTHENGLGIYRYNYIWDGEDELPRLGVMADEVARIMPDALGPIVDGYQTVDYTKLGGMFA